MYLTQLAAAVDLERGVAALPEMVGDLEVREEVSELVQPTAIGIQHDEVDDQRVHSSAVGAVPNEKRLATAVRLMRDGMFQPEMDRQVVAHDAGRRVSVGSRDFGACASSASRFCLHEVRIAACRRDCTPQVLSLAH